MKLKKLSNNKKLVFKILVMAIVLMFSGQISYARYMHTEILKGEQKVAQSILNLKEGIPIKIDTENKIGNYEFSIENFMEDNISEIGFWYTIEISLNIDLESLESNLNFKLYNDEGEIKLRNLKTEPIFIKGNKKIEQKYRLNIEYNEVELDNIDLNNNFLDKEENEIDEIIEKISGEIHIKINAEQEKI